MDISDYIAGFYDSNVEHEWQRMDRHRTEFAVTLRAMNDFLPEPPARILDCGGGPGRYAIELARSGYQVTLFDLSKTNLHLANEKILQAGVGLVSLEQGNALDLARFDDQSFDTVLLMGPLYHLLEETERIQALSEAYRVMKPGGVLFASFIGRYAAHRDMAQRDPGWILDEVEESERILRSGNLPPRGEHESGFVAYFAHPDEVAPLCQKAGFEIDTVLGVEGLVSMIEDKVNTITGAAWDAWVDLNYKVASDSSILGGVEHIMVVAHRPRWKTVLCEIADRLNREKVPYIVVGGTSAVLHGVNIRVKDIDIETDAAGAYRFQELFKNKQVEPVTLSEGKGVRSHFGRFDFDGVQVEIMGESYRLEADDWLPTWVRNQTIIDLAGVPVHVSWLEEETLAYIRRNRLQRAGMCLSLCDRERMLGLLRGEIPQGVI